MPTLLDLTWIPSAAQPTLPTDTFPRLGPAVYRNDTYTIHGSLTTEGEPWVPEGELAAQIRPARLLQNATVGDPLADFDVVVGGDDGNEFWLALTRLQAASLPDRWYWDLQETFDDDEATTWFTGKGKAWGDITRESGS
jgi:hypothetical protein